MMTAHQEYLAEHGLREDDCWQSVQERLHQSRSNRARERNLESHAAARAGLAKALSEGTTGGSITTAYTDALHGFAVTNVPRADALAGIATRYEDTEEEARYAAFILYLDTHAA